jgi:hypothetical protein
LLTGARAYPKKLIGHTQIHCNIQNRISDHLEVHWPKGASVKPENHKSARLVGLFLSGCVLFNFPLLALFNLDVAIGRIPLLFLFIFSGWGVFILLIFLAVK